ncbi:MAG: histidinol dehydrogenase, partial [Candidatus Wallbacteria bacterium]|nr:histidinol dehydrogenase [Candidatus Wallbacteria bacterium]
MNIVKSNNIPAEFFASCADTREKTVEAILKKVESGGDEALREYTLKFDGVFRENIAVDMVTVREASGLIDQEDLNAMAECALNIRKFAEAQFAQFRSFEEELQTG